MNHNTGWAPPQAQGSRPGRPFRNQRRGADSQPGFFPFAGTNAQMPASGGFTPAFSPAPQSAFFGSSQPAATGSQFQPPSLAPGSAFQNVPASASQPSSAFTQGSRFTSNNAFQGNQANIPASASTFQPKASFAPQAPFVPQTSAFSRPAPPASSFAPATSSFPSQPAFTTVSSGQAPRERLPAANIKDEKARGRSKSREQPDKARNNERGSDDRGGNDRSGNDRSAKDKRRGDKQQNAKKRGDRGQANASSNAIAAPTGKYPEWPSARFVNRPRPRSDDAAVLKLPLPLTRVSQVRDDWDVANQQKLESIEQQYLAGRRSLQSAYDEMNGMRDTERREMEKRGQVDSIDSRKHLDDAIKFVGSCTDMCPVFERVRRAHENNVFGLEKNAQGKVVREYAVKAFSRPAAGQPPPLPSDVRPPEILVSSLRYLVENVLVKLPASHAFLWDRTRSIRQDFTYQNYQGPEALWCFQVIARIHTVCLHVMARAVALQGVEWSQQQELEQFNKCLQSLSEFYQHGTTASEPEMRAYQLVSHFYDPEVAATVDRLAPAISRHPLVQLANELRSAANVAPIKFFDRVRQPDVPPTLRAIAEVHYNQIRVAAMRSIYSGVHKRMNMYPLARFTRMLGFETEEHARQFCEHYDLIISSGNGDGDEGDDEVDIRSWDEANVRDKRPLPQAADADLDARIETVDVTQPIIIGDASDATPVSQVIQSQIKPIGEEAKPKFNFAAPAFRPSSSTAISSPASVSGAPGSSTNNLANLGKPEEAQGASRADILAQKEALANKHAALKAQQEKARAAKLQAEHEADRQKAEAVQRAREAEQARKRAQQETARRAEEAAAAKRAQELRTAEQASLRARRSKFVEGVASRIFDRLMSSVCVADSAAITRAVDLVNRNRRKMVVETIKKTAASALDKQAERETQNEELSTFMKGRRVVSLGQFSDMSVDGLDTNVGGRDAGSPPGNGTSPSDRARHLPPLDAPVFAASVSATAPVGSMQRPEAPQSPAASRVVDYASLLPALRRGYNDGLKHIRVSADWMSPQGQWLRNALGLDSKLEHHIAVGPHETAFVTFSSKASKLDAVLVGPGGDAVESSVSEPAGETVKDLEAHILALVGSFLTWQEAQLFRHRSLRAKRRRISSGDSSNGSMLSDDSMSRPAKVRPSLLRQSIIEEANERARLRALIAEARQLAADL